MELKHTQAKRLRESVRAIAGGEAADALLRELPLSASPEEGKKREWACAACRALRERFPADTVTAIRKGCRCKPSPAAVKAMRAQWLGCDGLAGFAAQATASAKGAFVIEAEGDALVLVYPQCYCAFLKHGEGPVPAEWCACSLGYAEDMFAQASGHPCRAELLQSVLNGADTCRIRVSWPAGGHNPTHPFAVLGDFSTFIAPRGKAP